MRLTRMIGLGFAVALAATALIGASSATAETTALCNVDEDPCKEANQVTEVHYEAENINILSPLEGKYDYECDGLLSATVSKLGETQTLEAQSLVYTSCNKGCTRVTEKLGTFSVSQVESELAKITSKGFEIKVSCSGFSNCIYGFDGQVGTLKGPLLTGDNGHITYEETPLEKIGGGILCPSEAKFDALFVASNPIYVSS